MGGGGGVGGSGNCGCVGGTTGITGMPGGVPGGVPGIGNVGVGKVPPTPSPAGCVVPPLACPYKSSNSPIFFLRSI